MAKSSKIEPINIELFEKAWAHHGRSGGIVTKSSQKRRIKKQSNRKKKKRSKRKTKKRKSA